MPTATARCHDAVADGASDVPKQTRVDVVGSDVVGASTDDNDDNEDRCNVIKPVGLDDEARLLVELILLVENDGGSWNRKAAFTLVSYREFWFTEEDNQNPVCM